MNKKPIDIDSILPPTKKKSFTQKATIKRPVDQPEIMIRRPFEVPHDLYKQLERMKIEESISIKAIINATLAEMVHGWMSGKISFTGDPKRPELVRK